MKEKELLISIIEKEVGSLINEHTSVYGDLTLFTLEFLHKNRITLKILLMETEPNYWVIHHELSKENPFLLKTIARMCERIHRITEGKKTTITLSKDLKETLQQNLITTAMKCFLQNLFIKHFTLFKEKTAAVDHKPFHMNMNLNHYS